MLRCEEQANVSLRNSTLMLLLFRVLKERKERKERMRRNHPSLDREREGKRERGKEVGIGKRFTRRRKRKK